MEEHREAEPVERGRSVRAALDMEDEAGVAGLLGRPGGQARGRARAHGVAATRLEVVAADLPLGPVTAPQHRHEIGTECHRYAEKQEGRAGGPREPFAAR